MVDNYLLIFLSADESATGNWHGVRNHGRPPDNAPAD